MKDFKLQLNTNPSYDSYHIRIIIVHHVSINFTFNLSTCIILLSSCLPNPTCDLSYMYPAYSATILIQFHLSSSLSSALNTVPLPSSLPCQTTRAPTTRRFEGVEDLHQVRAKPQVEATTVRSSMAKSREASMVAKHQTISLTQSGVLKIEAPSS